MGNRDIYDNAGNLIVGKHEMRRRREDKEAQVEAEKIADALRRNGMEGVEVPSCLEARIIYNLPGDKGFFTIDVRRCSP